MISELDMPQGYENKTVGNQHQHNKHVGTIKFIVDEFVAHTKKDERVAAATNLELIKGDLECLSAEGSSLVVFIKAGLYYLSTISPSTSQHRHQGFTCTHHGYSATNPRKKRFLPYREQRDIRREYWRLSLNILEGEWYGMEAIRNTSVGRVRTRESLGVKLGLLNPDSSMDSVSPNAAKYIGT